MTQSDIQLFPMPPEAEVPPIDTEAVAESAGDRAIQVAVEQQSREADSAQAELGGGIVGTRTERASKHIKKAKSHIEAISQRPAPVDQLEIRRREVVDQLEAEAQAKGTKVTVGELRRQLYLADSRLVPEMFHGEIEEQLSRLDKPADQIHSGPGIE